MRLPEWVDVRSAPLTNDPALSLLDQGERCAILLAQSEEDVLLLIDETAGRLEASRRGIPNTGTVGVLRAAPLLGSWIFHLLLAGWLRPTFGFPRCS